MRIPDGFLSLYVIIPTFIITMPFLGHRLGLLTLLSLFLLPLYWVLETCLRLKLLGV